MNFEVNGMKAMKNLDPLQGPWYIEQVHVNMEIDVLDNIFSLMIERREDYVNPTTKDHVS